GLEPGLHVRRAVLEAQPAAHALSEVSLRRGEPLGKRALFTQSDPPHEAAGAENTLGIELVLDPTHQLKRRWRIAEDVDATLEFGGTALNEARGRVLSSDRACAFDYVRFIHRLPGEIGRAHV